MLILSRCGEMLINTSIAVVCCFCIIIVTLHWESAHELINIIL